MGVIQHQRSEGRVSLQKAVVRAKRNIVYQRSFVLEQETRKVYPYSIVPGGATSVEEAKLAMNRPDVRANYVNVNMAQLREVKLATNLAGYVSYRYGEKIYWTAKKLTLRAGETVFTDGVHIVRGRCLNCYSAVPMLPIRPTEPTEKVLDTPVDVPLFAYKFPMLPVETPTLPPPLEELTPTVPILPVVNAGNPGRRFLVPVDPDHSTHSPAPSSTAVGPATAASNYYSSAGGGSRAQSRVAPGRGIRWDDRVLSFAAARDFERSELVQSKTPAGRYQRG